MRAAGLRAGFGARLLLAQVLVILVGGVTLLAVALGLAPGMFRRHVETAVGPMTAEMATHLDMAFSRAILISLAVAITVATLTALAVGWFVSRRAARPLRELAEAAGAVASGDYTPSIAVPASQGRCGAVRGVAPTHAPVFADPAARRGPAARGVAS